MEFCWGKAVPQNKNIVWVLVLESWDCFLAMFAKDGVSLTAKHAIEILQRVILSSKGRMLLLVDEISKAENPQYVMNQIGVVLDLRCIRKRRCGRLIPLASIH